MSNSFVRVTEKPVEDSLILVIGEDGIITPDKQTVEEYLKSREETELRIMQVNKSDGRMVDVTVNHMTYIAAQKEEVMYEKTKEELEEIAKSLQNFRLDHDYTPFVHSPSAPDLPDIDELDHTLSLLEGNSDLDHSSIPELASIKLDSPKLPSPKISDPSLHLSNTSPSNVKINLIKTIPKSPIKIKPTKIAEPITHTETPIILPATTEASKPVPPKTIVSLKSPLSKKKVIPKPVSLKKSMKNENIQEDEDIDEDELDANAEVDFGDYDFSMESGESMDDTNDSDFEIEESPKTKTRLTKKLPGKVQLDNSKKDKVKTPVKPKGGEQTPKLVEPQLPPIPQPQPAISEVSTEKPQEKKLPTKKERKPPKPLPNDFMLFATPDIIRRVGGKQDSATPITPSTITDTAQASKLDLPKVERLNPEAKEKPSSSEKPAHRTSIDSKTKERRASLEIKSPKISDTKPEKRSRRMSSHRKNSTSKDHYEVTSSNQVDGTPSIRDIATIIQTEHNKNFGTDLVIPDTTNPSSSINKPLDDEDLTLTIDSIDEILYKVAETLADDKEFQSALDKSLDENLALNTSIANETLATYESNQVTPTTTTNPPLKGTQIIRSDGRVVVIPPIERPTTRSRNKVKNEAVENSKPTKSIPKVLDDSHVSGGELDSSSDDDKSDDDPEKLWCICNQPHNNRFMICCDNCEEWYHGKCVNVTKQMGQMMEKEGKEWICLYCKDLSLKRPLAAARRVRKASRNSATDNVEPTAITTEVKPILPVLNLQKVQPCIVCRQPCRNHSIFCSDACIVQNAKNVEKVVVFERSTGKFLSGNEAPTAANLEKWLKRNPGFEVVRSKATVTSKAVVISKTPNAKLQTVKDSVHQGASPALQKRGINVGLLKQFSKDQPESKTPLSKVQPMQPKTLSKVVAGVKSVKKLIQTKLTQSASIVNPAPISPPNKKRQSIQSISVDSQSTPKEKVKPKVPTPKSAVSTLSPEKKLENIRDSVKKSLGEQLMLRIESQSDIKLNKDEVAKITSEIESQLYKCFGDTGAKYRNKYRSLMFNIKDIKNQTLWRSICQKSINPYQLVRLSPDDLASQELASWRERENKHQLEMITKNELDQLGRTTQFVIKTHKGEQEVEDNRLSTGIDTTEVVTGLTADDDLESDANGSDKKIKDKDKKRTRGERDKKYDSSRNRDKTDRKDHKRDRRSSSRDRHQRRRSRSRSRGSLRHTDKHRTRSRDRHRRSAYKTSKHKTSPPHSTTDKLDKKSKEILENLVDNKIVPPLEDKLWKHVPQEDITTAPMAESDSDHEPTSTVTIPTPPHTSEQDEPNSSAATPLNVNSTQDQDSPVLVDDDNSVSTHSKSSEIIWSGTINMIDVAEITITAHEISGDCSGLGEELPSFLDVVGRIPPETVWDYISKMKSSNSKEIALLRLNSTSVEAQMPYIALYSYLHSRNRLGVVKSVNKAVKDFYVLPLSSHMPIPEALLPFSGGGLEDSRPVLLLGIIVRDKRKRKLFVSTPSVNKRYRAEKPSTPPIVHSSGRSYTPPPSSDLQYKTLRVSKSPIVRTAPEVEEDMDEPYSPKDSDPDTLPTNSEEESKPVTSSTDTSKIAAPVKPPLFLENTFIEPFSNKFDAIPGLDTNTGLLENHQLQREMEVLDQQIAKQKAEIQNMSQNIASTSGTCVGGALSNIELPSNIQQILDSIKTPQSTNLMDVQPVNTSTPADLTIPLMLPKISSRNNSSPLLPPSPSIPLNLQRFKNKSSSSNSPSMVDPLFDTYGKRTTDRSVLSSLSDDDLIRKANEMMQTTDEFNRQIPQYNPRQSGGLSSRYAAQPPLPGRSTTSSRIDSNQPPIPGLD